VGQLAWIAEKFRAWTGAEAVDRDHLLTNVMLYWLTGTAGTAADFYYEAAHSGWEFPAPSGVPTGVATFGRDVSIRRFAERSNVITQWTDYDEGGHFAAMEPPTCWSRTSVRSSARSGDLPRKEGSLVNAFRRGGVPY
jgi:hypothetical protein